MTWNTFSMHFIQFSLLNLLQVGPLIEPPPALGGAYYQTAQTPSHYLGYQTNKELASRLPILTTPLSDLLHSSREVSEGGNTFRYCLEQDHSCSCVSHCFGLSTAHQQESIYSSEGRDLGHTRLIRTYGTHKLAHILNTNQGKINNSNQHI